MSSTESARQSESGPPAPRTPASKPEASAHGIGNPVTVCEKLLEHGLDHVWHRFRKRPYLGASLAGGLGLALASVIGVGELAVGAGAAYAVYQMLKNRVPPSKALREALKLEEELH
jgi:hypothetical protein